MYIVKALGNIGDEKGFDIIKKELKDPDTKVREAAEQAYTKVSQLQKEDIKVVMFDKNGLVQSVDYSKQEARNLFEVYSAAKKGVSYEKSEQWLLAIEEHKKSIASAPKNDPSLATYHTNLGVCYANVGKLDKSIHEFEIALQIDPNDQRAMKNLENVKLLKYE